MLILQIAVGIVLGAIVLAFLPYILAGAAYIGVAALFLFLIHSFPEAAGWISAILLIGAVAYGVWYITKEKKWGTFISAIATGLLFFISFALVGMGLVSLLDFPFLAIASLSLGVAVFTIVVRYRDSNPIP
jgi:hypothetical protein